MSVTTDLSDKLRDVRSWNSLEIPETAVAFMDYGVQALNELGQNSVPFFNESHHLSPEFTGFVRVLNLSEGPYLNMRTLEDADFAYIENGKIRYTQKDKSDHSQGELCMKVSLRDGNFRVDEEYLGGGRYPYHVELHLVKRIRTAEYLAEDPRLRIQVTQDQTGKIIFRLDVDKEEYRYMRNGAVEIELEKDHVSYGQVISAMQSDPELFKDPRVTLRLLHGIGICDSSNVYYGFRDGKYGTGFSRKTRIIKETLTFEAAIKIAFPRLL